MSYSKNNAEMQREIISWQRKKIDLINNIRIKMTEIKQEVQGRVSLWKDAAIRYKVPLNQGKIMYLNTFKYFNNAHKELYSKISQKDRRGTFYETFLRFESRETYEVVNVNDHSHGEYYSISFLDLQELAAYLGEDISEKIFYQTQDHKKIGVTQ